MIDRRDVLRALAATAIGGVTPLSSTLAWTQTPAATPPAPASTGQPKDSATEDRLRKELDALAAREYSEEGVPVLLACEDLVGKKVPGPKLTDFNRAFAAEFYRTGEAWKHLRPDAAAGDVGKVIEVLADRDFDRGGKEMPAANEPPSFSEAVGTLAHAFATNPVIRAVNFHSAAKSQVDHYERQLAKYSDIFSSVSQSDLEHYLTTGEWKKSKPGLIVSVFEGYRNSFDVLAPMLEKYGFIGWFWIITNFINAPIPDQLNYAEHHDIDMLTHDYPDGRYAMTWDEIRQLDKKHVVASHTRSHTLLTSLSPEVQRQEVIGSQQDFEKNLGHPVRGFVSLTGPAYGENAAIDRLIDEAGYGLILSNFRVQRIRPA